MTRFNTIILAQRFIILVKLLHSFRHLTTVNTTCVISLSQLDLQSILKSSQLLKQICVRSTGMRKSRHTWVGERAAMIWLNNCWKRRQTTIKHELWQDLTQFWARLLSSFDKMFTLSWPALLPFCSENVTLIFRSGTCNYSQFGSCIDILKEINTMSYNWTFNSIYLQDCKSCFQTKEMRGTGCLFRSSNHLQRHWLRTKRYVCRDHACIWCN